MGRGRVGTGEKDERDIERGLRGWEQGLGAGVGSRGWEQGARDVCGLGKTMDDFILVHGIVNDLELNSLSSYSLT